MVRLRREDRRQRLRGRVACPLADGGGRRPPLGRDRGTANRRCVVEVAIHIGAIASESLGCVHRRVSLVDERIDL